jgi:hypothetical protein
VIINSDEFRSEVTLLLVNGGICLHTLRNEIYVATPAGVSPRRVGLRQ